MWMAQLTTPPPIPASKATVRNTRRYPNMRPRGPSGRPLVQVVIGVSAGLQPRDVRSSMAGEVVGVARVMCRVVQHVGAGEADAIDEHAAEHREDHGRGQGC